MSDNIDVSQMQHIRCTYNNVSNDIVYHAVYIPQENGKLLPDDNTNDNVHVYLNKEEALKIIKEYKTGRLKTFKKRSDAEEYAKYGYEPMCSYSCEFKKMQTSAITGEKSNKFKAPKSQELVSFRKLIERGDLQAVRDIAWTNPLYLISNGDTPAILHEGCRYNALHIAVKACRADMCELILSTVENPTFIQLLYGEQEHKSYLDRAQIMLDLYLNMPDKGLNETPLHFAAKFGLRDVVRVLVSYSLCIKTVLNKYKQMPIDIICSRKCQDNEELKREIRMLLEDQYYVPVLRSEDNTLQPTIGEPFSPTNPLKLNNDPISPRVEVRAFAGPMTKSQAQEFRRKWKTPPRTYLTSAKMDIDNDTSSVNSPSLNRSLRLQDTEKGLECIGRELAEKCQVPWKEYWPFLNDFADFRCAEGLAKLEKYLEKRFKEHSCFNKTRITHIKDESISKVHSEKLSDISDLCQNLQVCTLVDQSQDNSDTPNSLEGDTHLHHDHDNYDDLEYFTPPSSPKLTLNNSDDEMFPAEEGSVAFIERTLPTKLDYAVYNAISTSISPNIHPNIYRWRHEMQLAMKRNLFRFSNPGMVKRKLLMNS